MAAVSAVTGFADLLKARTDVLPEAKPTDEAGIIVPDVVGLSLREAMESFGASGIAWRSVSPHGQGFVTKQGFAPGTRWVESKGRKIELELTFTQ